MIPQQVMSAPISDRNAFGDLVIEVRRNIPGVVRLDWKGKSNDSHPEAVLSPLFSSVTGLASRSRLRVEMHFEELEFFNSSTITALVRYVKDLRHLQIALAIFFRADLRWQRIFFDALQIFMKDDGLLTLKAIP